MLTGLSSNQGWEGYFKMYYDTVSQVSQYQSNVIWMMSLNFSQYQTHANEDKRKGKSIRWLLFQLNNERVGRERYILTSSESSSCYWLQIKVM